MKALEIRCPVSRTLKVIGGKWKSLIIYHLNEGDRRNGQLRRAIPEITQKMLTQQLRELERDGLVERAARGLQAHRSGDQRIACAGSHGVLGRGQRGHVSGHR